MGMASQNKLIMTPSIKSLHVHCQTLGCQMNDNDTEVMSGLLLRAGHMLVQDEQEADVLLINTCSVREFAEHKAYSQLGEWGKRKQEDPDLIIGVVGCMAQNQRRDILRRMPYVDIVCGPQHITKIPQLIARVSASRERLLEVEDSDEFTLKAIPILRSDPLKAFVTIMRGCDKTCTYCIVPKTRGKEISRDAQEIIDEIADVAERGTKEVTLLGQNVNSYGKGLTPEVDFARLLHHVHDVDGIERIRFVTSHPMDITDAMIDAIGELPKVCEYLHFPLQSGSDKVLRRMKRYYTRERYMDIVGKMRAKKPGMALSTDIIVGFPGETEEDFQMTVETLKEIQYDMAFLFKYSVRPGTPAEKLGDDVPKAEKERRHQILLDLQNEITLKHNQASVGKNVEVLVEGPSASNPGRWAGRTRENKLAVFETGAWKPGDIVPMTVQEATAYTLRCVPVIARSDSDEVPKAFGTSLRPHFAIERSILLNASPGSLPRD